MSFVFPRACADPILDKLGLRDIVVLYCVDRKTRSYLDTKYSGMVSYTLARFDDLSEEDILYVCAVLGFEDRLKSMLPTLGVDTISRVCKHIISLGRLSTLKSISKTGEIATFKYNNWRFTELIRYAVSCDAWDILCYIFTHLPPMLRLEEYDVACTTAIYYGNKEMLKKLVTSDMYNKNDMEMLFVLIAIDDNDIFDTYCIELFCVCVRYCIIHDTWEIFEDLVSACVKNDHITDRIMGVVHMYAPRSSAISLQRYVDISRYRVDIYLRS